MSYDFASLRHDLMDYFGTAAFSGLPFAMGDVIRVENASQEELLRIARQNGFDLSKYSTGGLG